MCGISGIYSHNTRALDDIHAMINALDHRGPDANGVFVDRDHHIALGHNRLSIIDLSTAANQPFTSSQGRYVIAFNGEVYNFQRLRESLQQQYNLVFKTTSDTEVIVEAFSKWGPGMASKLEGMFALAIYDQLEQKLFLLRDRLGKKPLYYFNRGNTFAFASEIKSLLQVKGIREQSAINRSAVNHYLHLGYIPEPDTIYQHICKFPSASFAVVDQQMQVKITRYWSLDTKLASPRKSNEDEAKREFHTLLDSAVRDRLIADVPIGAFLSGGVDSSLVTALAVRHVNKPLKTFSIGFEESKFDESSYAREVAKHLGTDHTEYKLAEAEAVQLLETYLRHFDEPFADTSAIPTMLVSNLARKEVTVTLTGDGGDELFQGYGAYTWANRMNRLQWQVLSPALGWSLRSFGSSRLKRVARLFEHNRVGGIRSHIFSQEQYFFSQRELREHLLKSSDSFHPFIYDDPAVTKHVTAGEKQALFDLNYYLKDDLLVKVDRASMFYALECRCPLLDHRVVEFAFSLDHSLKIKSGTQKYLPKLLLADYLPAELINRPKWGFSVPLAKWLKGDLRFLLEEYLSRDAINSAGLFNFEYVDELKTQFMNGVDYLYNRLWLIIVLQKWWKEKIS